MDALTALELTYKSKHMPNVFGTIEAASKQGKREAYFSLFGFSQKEVDVIIRETRNERYTVTRINNDNILIKW